MPNNKNRPTFNHRAVAIGAAISPFSFWLFHGNSATYAFVVAGSILTILTMALISVLLWDAGSLRRNAERRRRIGLALDAFVNAVFGHGLTFVLIVFVHQAIQRFM